MCELQNDVVVQILEKMHIEPRDGPIVCSESKDKIHIEPRDGPIVCSESKD
jgi:hypothetical protein